jgi:tetratricopeptide (TPR) repeat protein
MNTTLETSVEDIIREAQSLAEHDTQAAVQLLMNGAGSVTGTGDRGRLLNVVAEIHQAEGRCVEALQTYEAAADDLRAAAAGDTTPDLSRALIGVFVELQHLDRHEEAFEIAEEHVERARCTGAAPGHLLVEALVNRGVTLEALGRPFEAIVDLDMAQLSGARLLTGDGADDHRFLSILARADAARGEALCSQGRCAEALTALESAVSSYRRSARLQEHQYAGSLEHARALRNLGAELEAFGRCVEAAAAFDQAISLLDGVDLPAAEVELAIALSRRAMSLLHVQRPLEAEMAAGRAVRMIEYFGQGSPGWNESRELAFAWAMLGRAHAAQGECEEAAEALRHADTVFALCAPPHDRTWLEVRGELAMELSHTGSHPEAIERFESLLDDASDAFDEDESVVGLWMKTLAHAYEQVGDSERAALLSARARAILGEEDEEDSEDPTHEPTTHVGYIH